MSNTENTNQHPRHNSKGKGSMKSITRRGIIAGGGAVGLATLTLSRGTMANTQIQPESGKTDSDGKFRNKVVLITGATSGIGEVTARAFAKEGAIVHFCGRREALGEKVTQTINAQGGRASYQRADVRKEQDIKAFIDSCIQKHGRIDIAFNNAGVESPPGTIAEHSLETWTNVMTTNATGVFLSMKYELPVMLQQKGGIIVNNASVSGTRRCDHFPL